MGGWYGEVVFGGGVRGHLPSLLKASGLLGPCRSVGLYLLVVCCFWAFGLRCVWLLEGCSVIFCRFVSLGTGCHWYFLVDVVWLLGAFLVFGSTTYVRCALCVVSPRIWCTDSFLFCVDVGGPRW